MKLSLGIDEGTSAKMIQQAKSLDNYCELVQKATDRTDVKTEVADLLEDPIPRKDFNAARVLVGAKPLRVVKRRKSRTTKKLAAVEKAS